MNKGPLLYAAAIAVTCYIALATLASWPPLSGHSLQTVTEPAWWQLQSLAGFGFLLHALPATLAREWDISPPSSLYSMFITGLVQLEVVVLMTTAYFAARFVAWLWRHP